MAVYVNPSLATGDNDGSSAANALQTGDLTSYSGSGNAFLLAASSFASPHRTGFSFSGLTGTNSIGVYDPAGGSNATVWCTGRKTVSGAVNTTGDVYEVTGIGATAPTAAVWDYTQDDSAGTVTGVSSITVKGTELVAAYGFLLEGTFDALNDGEWAYDSADGGTLQIRRAGTDASEVDSLLEYCLQETAFGLTSCDDVEFDDDDGVYIGDCFPDGSTSRNNYGGLRLSGCNSILAYRSTFLARNSGYRFHGDVSSGNDGGHRIGGIGGIGVQTDHGAGNTTAYCGASYSTQAAADNLDSRWGVSGGIVFKPHPHLGTDGAPIRNFTGTSYNPKMWLVHGNTTDKVGGIHLYDVDYYVPQTEMNAKHTLTMEGPGGGPTTQFGHGPTFTETDPTTYPVQVHKGSFHTRNMNEWLSASSKLTGVRGVWFDRCDFDNIGIDTALPGSAGNTRTAIFNIQANTTEGELETCYFTSCNHLFNRGSTPGWAFMRLWGHGTTVYMDSCNSYNTLTGTVALRSHHAFWDNEGASLDTLVARGCIWGNLTANGEIFRADNLDMTGNFTTESCMFSNGSDSILVRNGQGSGDNVTEAEWAASFDSGTCVYNQDSPGWNDPGNGDFSFVAGGGGYIENNEYTDIAGLANDIGFNDEAYSGTYGSYQQGGLFTGTFDASSSNVQANGTQAVLYWDAPDGDWATAIGADILRDATKSISLTANGSPVTISGVLSIALTGGADSSLVVALTLGGTITAGQTVEATVEQGAFYDLNDKVSGAASESEITNDSTQEAAATGGGAARNRSRSRARATAIG